MSLRTTDDGGPGPDEGLVPVIPLFGPRGGTSASSQREVDGVLERGRQPVAGVPESGVPESDAESADDAPAGWHTTWGRDAKHADRPLPLARERDPVVEAHDPDPTAQRDQAEQALLRKLRARSLSVAEARTVLAQHGLARDEIDSMLDEFVRRGYLDDAALAEQLVHVGVDRKGQGRQAIAMSLAKRGIPRDVADRALTAVPDDDARALEYAESKARSMCSLDRDTALRRLSGQLVRRGYSGAVALAAARTALGAASPGSGSGVRFD